MTALAPTLQAFFTDRLAQQLGASGHTIAAYRDTWRLLLTFTAARTGIPPTRLDIATLDAALIAQFLNHLETERGNSTRTRNARLAAINSTLRSPRCATPNTPRRSPESWPSHPNVTTDARSPISPQRRSPLSWAHPFAGSSPMSVG